MEKETIFGLLNIFKEKRSTKKTWEYLNNPDKAHWRELLPFEEEDINDFMNNSFNSQWGYCVFVNRNFLNLFYDVKISVTVDSTSKFLRVKQSSNNVADKLSPQIFLQLDREKNDLNIITSPENLITKSPVRLISSDESWGLSVLFFAKKNNECEFIHFGCPVTRDFLGSPEKFIGDLKVEKVKY